MWEDQRDFSFRELTLGIFVRHSHHVRVEVEAINPMKLSMKVTFAILAMLPMKSQTCKNEEVRLRQAVGCCSLRCLLQLRDGSGL